MEGNDPRLTGGLSKEGKCEAFSCSRGGDIRPAVAILLCITRLSLSLLFYLHHPTHPACFYCAKCLSHFPALADTLGSPLTDIETYLLHLLARRALGDPSRPTRSASPKRRIPRSSVPARKRQQRTKRAVDTPMSLIPGTLQVWDLLVS